MTPDLWLAMIATGAALGAVLMGLIAWQGQSPHEPFSLGKFLASLASAIVAGIGFAVVYNFGATPGIRDVFAAILGGSGLHAVAFTSGLSKMLPTSPTEPKPLG